MPWCPKCRCEYVDGVLNCNDCGENLVPYLEENNDEYICDMPAFLTTVKNDFEADVIESLLKGYNIPVERKYRNIDGYIKIVAGISYNEVQIFVPSKLLSVSKEILNSPNETLTDERISYVDNEYNADSNFELSDFRKSTSKIFTYIIISMFVLMTLLKYLLAN